MMQQIWDLILGFLTSKYFLQLFFIPGIAFIGLFTLIVVWFERKLLARVMLRYGPLHVGRVAGILQTLADTLKLLFKEFIPPRKAHKLGFYLAPVFYASVPTLALTAIPFSPTWIVYPSDVGLLIAYAVIACTPILPIIAGWACNNRYTMIGGLRIIFQDIAGEIPLLLSALGVVMLSGSFNLVNIVNAQSRYWFILLQPLGALVFFISLIAMVERVPFDIPTAEQELVFGWRTEYGGILFGLTMFGEYISLAAGSLLFSTLYLGGYLGPNPFPGFIPSDLASMAWILLKMAVMVTVLIVIRGAYPRLRIDQLLNLGWKWLIPLAMINTVLTMLMIYFFPWVGGA